MNKKVKALHMAVGVDLIGSATSLAASRNMDLELVEAGVLATSKKTNRVMLIPYSNIKGLELMPEAPAVAPEVKLQKPQK
jgi:hypothetical protein